MDQAGGSRSSLRLLQASSFTSAFDRMAIAPMLVAISGDLDVSLGQVTLVATAYYLLYGAMQPVWGLLSDRLGRVNVIRLTLAGAAVASAASALAPSLGVLVAARACAGALFAGVIPTVLVYVGDTVPMARRQVALVELMGATSAGMAVSTVLAGVAVVLADWRLVFGISAVVAALLSVGLARLPEPATERAAGALGAIGALLRRPWPRTVVVLALVEGTVVLGIITFMAPALEHAGLSAAVAGLTMGVYGAATVGWTRAVRRVAPRLAPASLIAIGAALLALGLLAAALDPNLGRHRDRRGAGRRWLRLHALDAAGVGDRGRGRPARHRGVAVRGGAVHGRSGGDGARGPARGRRRVRRGLLHRRRRHGRPGRLRGGRAVALDTATGMSPG
jgi:MFS family permease